MTQRSLRRRLLQIGLITIALTLLVAGGGLTLLFEHHVERTLDDDLDAFVHQIAASLESDPATGELSLSKYASDPRFDEPLSGYYWQVVDTNARRTLASRSLQDSRLSHEEACIVGPTRHRHIIGPAGEKLLAGQLCLNWQGASGSAQVQIITAIDVDLLRPIQGAFTREMFFGLIVLGAVLTIALWFQVELGIAPLAELRVKIREITRGESTRLGMLGPKEILPLIEELNALLDERAEEAERARNHAADLAHGLKLARRAGRGFENAERARTERDRRIARESDRGDAENGRSRTGAGPRQGRDAGPKKTPARRVAVVEPLVRTLVRTGTEVDFDVNVPPTLTTSVHGDDLMELIGNLLENASRYALALVRLTATMDEGFVNIIVEDDGPGLPEGAKEIIRQRGRRLDESGSAGLGLAIVQDILDAYGSSMEFSQSPLGGLRVDVRLAS